MIEGIPYSCHCDRSGNICKTGIKKYRIFKNKKGRHKMSKTKNSDFIIDRRCFNRRCSSFRFKEAEFGGSDDAGSVMVEEIHGEYEPWFTPVLETALDRELPGEIESLIFCIQTGIGVGIIAFIMGRFVERKNGRIVTGDNAFEVLREKQKS